MTDPNIALLREIADEIDNAIAEPATHRYRGRDHQRDSGVEETMTEPFRWAVLVALFCWIAWVRRDIGRENWRRMFPKRELPDIMPASEVPATGWIKIASQDWICHCGVRGALETQAQPVDEIFFNDLLRCTACGVTTVHFEMFDHSDLREEKD